MKLLDCENLYHKLAKKNNCDYAFKWSRRVHKFRRAGSCCTGRKLIKLQPTFVELNSDADIKDTLLHEIAHALTPHHKHDEVWRKKAIEIGCNGERYYGSHIINNKNKISPWA